MGVIGLTLLLTGGLAASGCGEAKHPASTAASAKSVATTTSAPAAGGQGSAGQATGSTTTTDGSAGGATAEGASSAQNGAASAASGRSVAVGGKGRSKAHMVLPGPNSRPAPKLHAGAAVPVADISLSSSALRASGATLPARHTCAGADQSLPLHWSGVPVDTQELVLFAVSERPVGRKLFFDWALAGLSPSLQGLAAGEMPAGAVLGKNGYGHTSYSICPTSGKRESYIFELYALPQRLTSTQGFDPASLRRQATHVARHVGLLVGTYG